MPSSAASSHVLRKTPKHVRHMANRKTGLGGITRQASSRFELFVPRRQDESLREWLQRNQEASLVSRIVGAALVLLSVYQAFSHVILNWKRIQSVKTEWIIDLDLVTTIVFTIEYLFRLYIAFDRLGFVMSPISMADFLVLLPTFMDELVLRQLAANPSSMVPFISRLLRPVRFVRLFRFLQFTTSSLQRQVLATLLTLVCIVVITAGVLQAAEACDFDAGCEGDVLGCGCQDLSFFDFLYFVVVSISTLGYGDIFPVTAGGRFLTAFIILFTFVAVPIRLSRIQQIIASHTDYSSSFTEAKLHPHVVITGHIDADMLTVFFGEFFHTSNLNWNVKAVILNAAPPSTEVRQMLKTFEGRAQYIVGSPLLDEDLERAVIASASACYVLVNRRSRRPQHADQCSALITIALRRGNATCPIYSQVINAVHASTLLKMGATDVVTLGMMKYLLLGRSCELRGLPTLLLNLLSQTHDELNEHMSPYLWQRPYLHGVMHGIFLIDIPRTFSGLTYGDMCRFLYEKKGIVAVAMLTEDGVQFVDMDFKLGATADPNLCCKVYAVAKGLSEVESVAEIPPEQILSYRKNTRRKAKAVDAAGSEGETRRKKIRPALGNEVDSIQQSLVALYSTVNRFDSVDGSTGVSYDEFISVGVPPDISGHIVVCGFPSDTFQFLKTIREAPMQSEEEGPPAVVFLSPGVLDEFEFAKLTSFQRIFLVVGSPVNFVDLKKTRIASARSVLILAHATESKYADPNMVDADAITTVRYIVEISQRTRIPNLVVELTKASNVKLLTSVANERRTSKLLDLPMLLSRQNSYRSAARVSQPHRDSFWTRLDDGDAHSDASLVVEEFIASGRVYSNNLLDALLSESYRKPWITSFVFLLLDGNPDDREERRMFQVEAPDELLSRTYGECFRKLLDLASCTCLGLWRPERGLILPHPCVFANPPPELQVEPGDQFFLVGKPFTFASSSGLFTADRRGSDF